MTKQPKPKTFFISDLHVYHKNIIKYDNRPFFTVTEMNNTLISNWNTAVSPQDTVYILGDVSWGNITETDQFLSQLNGKKNLIIGNHDDIILHSKQLQNHFESINYYAKIKVSTLQGTKTVILSHFFIPFYDGHYKQAILLHGHSHVTAERNEELRIAKELNHKGFDNQIYNVGCMLPYMGYTPRTLDELLCVKT